jgi:hypothetical protein
LLLSFENQVASYLEYASSLSAYSELWTVGKIDQTAQLRVSYAYCVWIFVFVAGQVLTRFPAGSPALQGVQRATDEIGNTALDEIEFFGFAVHSCTKMKFYCVFLSIL